MPSWPTPLPHPHHKPSGLMVKGLQFPKKPKFHGLILYPRATCSTDRPWRPVYPPEATSGYDMAKSWSASIVGQARIRTVKFPMYPASKPTIGASPLTLLSHIAHTP